MAINETLKFSWGHIIAFVAMVFISYVSFIGATYLTDGNFLYAGIGIFIINIVLIALFIVPQLLKGTDVKFSKKIIYERILFFAAPIFFLIIMVPYAHFWTVFSHRAQVESNFTESIEMTTGLFDSYEQYANNRIETFEKKLSDSVKIIKPATRKKPAVTEPAIAPEHQKTLVDALKLQLIDENYYVLKDTASEWIESSSGATVWNVFLIGNVNKIEAAIENWNNILSETSEKKMADEAADVEAFSKSNSSIEAARKSLKELRSAYGTMEFPTILAIITALVLYAMLILPYIIQRRNTKSLYHLIGSKNITSSSRDVYGKNDSFEYNETSSQNNDDYGSFTI